MLLVNEKGNTVRKNNIVITITHNKNFFRNRSKLLHGAGKRNQKMKILGSKKIKSERRFVHIAFAHSPSCNGAIQRKVYSGGKQGRFRKYSSITIQKKTLRPPPLLSKKLFSAPKMCRFSFFHDYHNGVKIFKPNGYGRQKWKSIF